MRALVQLLNDRGVLTFDSCCGHGERWGHITIRLSDVEGAQHLGLRVCADVGVSQPMYPFSGAVEGYANIVIPPILTEQERLAS